MLNLHTFGIASAAIAISLSAVASASAASLRTPSGPTLSSFTVEIPTCAAPGSPQVRWVPDLSCADAPGDQADANGPTSSPTGMDGSQPAGLDTPMDPDQPASPQGNGTTEDPDTSIPAYPEADPSNGLEADLADDTVIP